MQNKTRKKDTVSSIEQESRKSHMKLAIWGAVLFYLLLYVVSKWFPIITGHAMQSDWAVILVSSVPLIIAIAYMVMDIFPTIKGKVAGVEFSLEKVIQQSANEVVHFSYRLTDSYFEAEDLRDLNKQIEQIINSGKSPRILVVPLQSETRVTFLALKQYIHGLASIPSMQFIIFVGEYQRYLGFMPIESFTAKYPRTSLEFIIEDMIRDEGSAKYWSRTFQLNNTVNLEKLNRDLRELSYKQWAGENISYDDEFEILEQINRLQRKIDDNLSRGADPILMRKLEQLKRLSKIESLSINTGSDVMKLGANHISISRETSPVTVYNLMKTYRVNGIPLINEDEKFLGMIMKEDLLDQLLEQILKNFEDRQA